MQAHAVTFTVAPAGRVRLPRSLPQSVSRCRRATERDAPDKLSSPQPELPQQPQQAQQAQQPAMPQSPASFFPSMSGISVSGHSPTSPQGWAKVKQALVQADVKFLSSQEMLFAQSRGAPVIDVRPVEQYEEGHVPGAVSVPFYQLIQGWEPTQALRRVGYALFGVLNGTEVNPNFVQDASAQLSAKAEAILYCSIGGQTEPMEGNKKGLQSRSLIAAWALVTQVPDVNLSVLKGGFSEYVRSGRDVVALVEDGE
mmetsp:Transcript_1285/g.2066  ORF Transcript_1285/g.2066 Transcript_1285/m.2066 type:complete len:255 (+) Transcript_1285:44-808(+)